MWWEGDGEEEEEEEATKEVSRKPGQIKLDIHSDHHIVSVIFTEW